MLTIRKEKLNVMPLEFTHALRNEVRLAMESIGVSTIDEACYSELCLDAGLERCVLASFSDAGDHIEFGLSLRGRGYRSNLVHALLVMKDADFWVRSDVYPDLNGRVKVDDETRGLFDRTLACIRGPKFTPDFSETKNRSALPRFMSAHPNEAY